MLKRPDVVLPPVRPSAGIESAYRKRLQALVRTMAKSMIVHVRAAYRHADPDIGFAHDASADGDPIVRIRSSMTKWGKKWTQNIETASVEIAQLFARRVGADTQTRMMAHLRNAGFTVQFKPTPAMTQAYRLTVEQNVNLIKSIPAQFLKDVQTSVWQSVMKGGDLGALTKDIEKNYGVSHRRAAFIAQDQNAKARAVFEEVRRAEIGVREAEWVHSGGGKTPRPEHVKWGAQRKRYDIKQGMWSSVDGEYVWPGTAPRCRCVSRSIFPGTI